MYIIYYILYHSARENDTRYKYKSSCTKQCRKFSILAYTDDVVLVSNQFKTQKLAIHK